MWKNTAFFLPCTIFKKCTRSIKKIKIRQGRKKMPTISCNLFTFLLKVSGKSRCQKMGFFFGRVGHKNAKPMR